jgi:hypothetical protein
MSQRRCTRVFLHFQGFLQEADRSWRKTRRGKHEIANGSKEQIRGKLNLEWCAYLVRSCPPWWVACLCPPWLWGFSSGAGGEDVKWWRSVRVDLQGTQGGLFYWLWERVGSDDWLAYVIGIPSGRVLSPNAKVFHWTVFMAPESRIFYGFCIRGRLFSRIRLK